jgi:hypothetical protein
MMSLFEDIGASEGFKDSIYIDHVGVPTIGVGYNLRNLDVLKGVLAQFGYSSSTLSATDFDNLVNDLVKIFKQEDWSDSNKSTKITTVNDKLKEYKKR